VRNKKPLVMLIILVLFAGCSKKQEPSPITVNKKEDIYENEYFKFTIEKPRGWYSRSVKESLLSQHRNKKGLSGKTDESEMDAIIDQSMEKTLPLFSFFEFRHGSQIKLNPSVLAIAQNTKNFPEAKNSCDYLKHVMAVLEKGQIKYIFEPDCKELTLKGKNFSVVNAYAKMGKDIVYQNYYATISGKHTISIITTYFDNETKKAVEAVISSIEFKP